MTTAFRFSTIACICVASLAMTPARAQDEGGAAPAARAPAAVAAKLPPAGIQWFATWDQALREAKRTRRPILLVAAAPQCHDVSGLW